MQKKAKIDQKVVVTGGAGFIGSHIVDALLGRGFEVHVIDNLSGGKRENVNPKAVFHQTDIRELPVIQPIIKGAKFVFHLAALPRVQYSIENPAETHEVNVTGTQNVLIAAHEGGVSRVIYSASSSAYGDQPARPNPRLNDKVGQDSGRSGGSVMPLVETMKVNPQSPYGLHKYVGEVYAQVWSTVYSLPTVSLRYFNVYGPRMNPDGAYPLAIGKFLKLRQAGKPLTIWGDGTQTRDFTHVRDVVEANLLAAESDKVGKGEVINIGAGKNFSINKIAELIGGPVVHEPPRLEPHDTLADNSLAKKLLGWQSAVTLEEGIAELKELYKV